MVDFKILEKTPLYSVLSDLGRRIFLPDGIFYWSGRAKKEADIIGTIGSAFGYEKDFIDGGSNEWVPCYLKEIKDYSNMNIRQIVTYADIGGTAVIREIWKNWIIKKSKTADARLGKYLSNPIVTQGITNGIYMICAFLLSPGEIIISPNKRWGNYDNIITKFLGVKIHSFEFFNGQNINLEGLKNAIEEVAKKQDKIVIILNFPNNPTGYCPTKEEGKEIVKILKESQKAIKKPIVVICDDAYEPFTYGDNVIEKSIFYDLHDLEEDVIPIKLDGISKELLAYGGRIGFVTFGLKPKWVSNDEELELLNSELNNKLEGMTRSTISNCNHLFQEITQRMFTEKGMDELIKTREKVRELLKARYEKMNEELAKIDDTDVSVDPNSGGFFLFMNLNPKKIKASEFADHLLKKYKIGIIPIEKLDNNINGIRIAYCSIDIEKIPEFAKRIGLALKDY